MRQNIDASVIISTYNQPNWLDLVLYSYEIQSVKTFEIIIADDGSDAKTKAVIDDFKTKTNLNICHVWHQDKGFRKTEILNKAVLKSNSEYLIFTDGDCLARRDFVETHLNLRKTSNVLSGGYYKLTEKVSHTITKDILKEQICFSRSWLLGHGQPKNFKINKLTTSKFLSRFLNRVTTTKATFDGMNASCYKIDFINVNGFDERMRYGGEDRELGERLMNNGITFIQVRYSAICLHLYHKRPYKNNKDLELNKQIRNDTKKNGSTNTPFGINI